MWEGLAVPLLALKMKDVMSRVCGQLLKAENDSRPTTSQEMGTSVL